MDAGGGAGKKRTFAGEGFSKGVSQDDKVLHTTVFVSKYVSTTYKRKNGTYLILNACCIICQKLKVVEVEDVQEDSHLEPESDADPYGSRRRKSKKLFRG
jgi:hypothetical protein